MLPTIWLKSLSGDSEATLSAISKLHECSALLDAVRSSYALNAAKYFRTLQTYDLLLASMDSNHTTKTENQHLADTLEAASGTSAINFQLYRDSESNLWLGMTFNDPDLINSTIIDILQSHLSIDTDKNSMLGGVAISKMASTDRKASVNVNVNLPLSFTVDELMAVDLSQEPKFINEMFSNIILLLTIRNKELCATIDPQTIKDKINAIRDSNI